MLNTSTDSYSILLFQYLRSLSRASCEAPEKSAGVVDGQVFPTKRALAMLKECEDYGGQSQSSQSSKDQLQSSQGKVCTVTVACPAFGENKQRKRNHLSRDKATGEDREGCVSEKKQKRS